MSMMEILASMRRALMGEKKEEPLPWYCLILSDKCTEPDTDCIDCHVYDEHKEELVRNGSIAGKMRKDSESDE